MNGRRFMCFVLGAWLAGCLAVALMAMLNSAEPERVLARLSPAAVAQVKAGGAAQLKALLQHQAGELNRKIIANWCNAQIAMGFLAFFYLLFGTREGRYALALALAVTALVVLQRTMLLPEIVSLARLAELVGPDTDGAAGKLWVAESAYYGVEVLKAVVGLAVAGWLVFNPRERSRYSGKNVDVVDKPDNRHVDR